MRMTAFFKKGMLRHLLLFIFSLSIASFLLFTVYSSMHHPVTKENEQIIEKRELFNVLPNKQVETDVILRKNTETIDNSYLKSESKSKNSSTLSFINTTLNHNIHIFYYPWYKNELIDGKYTHWNHEVIPDWHKPATSRRRQYVPPGDIGANFYPKLGPYSSHDPKVIETHMQQMRFMGTGVVCVSWYPPMHVKATETGVDDLMMAIFDTAAKYGLKVTFHIEPYDNRSGKTLLEVSTYIINTYGNHSALYRTSIRGRNLPVYYVYDSYQIPEASWAQALKPDGIYSIRNTKYDAVFLGLLVDKNHFNHLSASGFDGFYTYFAANSFSYGSSWIHWHEIANEAKKRHLIFVPSIGPGYLDTRVRPWNNKNARLRLKGKYYRKSFYNALSVKPYFMSITSYNEWHEGTQVEPAIPKTHEGYKYSDYSPNPPEFYLNLTRQFVVEYTRNMTTLQLHKHDDSF